MRLLYRVGCPLLLVISCANAETPDETGTEQQRNKVLAMECTDFDFVAEILDQEARLELPEFTGVIPQVAAASGTKYQGNNITFWLKGQEATLQYGNNSHKDCRNNSRRAVWEKARLRGIDFMAMGNEPGWTLEITSNSLLLVSDYGNSRYYIANAEREADAQTQSTVYRGTDQGKAIQVTLKTETCNDTMADASYQTSVKIKLGEQTLQGCGETLSQGIPD